MGTWFPLPRPLVLGRIASTVMTGRRVIFHLFLTAVSHVTTSSKCSWQAGRSVFYAVNGWRLRLVFQRKMATRGEMLFLRVYLYYDVYKGYHCDPLTASFMVF